MPQEKKKGFGEKLKDVGRAIGRKAKEIPGTIYREGIKPEAKRILEKFTEEGPAPKRTISREPQAGTTTAPFEEGPKGFRGPTAKERELQREISRRNKLPAKILSPAEQVSKPAPTIKEQLKRPVSYPLARGATTSYDVPLRMIPRPGETMKTPAFLARRKKARDEKNRQQTPRGGGPPTLEVAPGVRNKPAPAKTTTEGRTKAQRGSVGKGYRTPPVTATAKKDKPPTSGEIAFTAKRRQRAGLEASRKGKGGKRKYSATKTYKEIGKAAAASQKPVDIQRIDTSGLEMARLMTEQDVSREAERAEAALKKGRTPRREKARYRYQTRGYKRSEGRSR